MKLTRRLLISAGALVMISGIGAGIQNTQASNVHASSGGFVTNERLNISKILKDQPYQGTNPDNIPSIRKKNFAYGRKLWKQGQKYYKRFYRYESKHNIYWNKKRSLKWNEKEINKIHPQKVSKKFRHSLRLQLYVRRVIKQQHGNYLNRYKTRKYKNVVNKCIRRNLRKYGHRRSRRMNRKLYQKRAQLNKKINRLSKQIRSTERQIDKIIGD